jgi:hypothetical protein
MWILFVLPQELPYILLWRCRFGPLLQKAQVMARLAEHVDTGSRQKVCVGSTSKMIDQK